MAKIPFTFRFDETCHAKIRKIAQREKRSMSNLIEYLCWKEIEAHEAKYGEILLTDEDFSEE